MTPAQLLKKIVLLCVVVGYVLALHARYHVYPSLSYLLFTALMLAFVVVGDIRGGSRDEDLPLSYMEKEPVRRDPSLETALAWVGLIAFLFSVYGNVVRLTVNYDQETENSYHFHHL